MVGDASVEEVRRAAVDGLIGMSGGHFFIEVYAEAGPFGEFGEPVADHGCGAAEQVG